MAALARDKGYKRIFVPATDAQEATLLPGVEVVAVGSLADLANALNGLTNLPVATHDMVLDARLLAGSVLPVTDFKEVKGQDVCPKMSRAVSNSGERPKNRHGQHR